MKKLYFFSAIIFFSYNTKAQVGIGTTAPRAALDITSSTNGFLAPQVALTSTTTASPVVNPQGGGTPISGTIVYNTATAGNVTPGYYYWNGLKWVRLALMDEAVNGITGTAPITIGGTATTPIVGISNATSSATGALTSSDWNTFNGKVSSVTAGSTKISIGGTSIAPTIDVVPANLGSITLATGTTGTDVNVTGSPASLAGTLTLNIPDASVNNRGLITTGAQTLAGIKTFTSIPIAPTAAAGTNTTQLATTAFVNNAIVKSYNSSGAITNQIKKWYGTVAGTQASAQSIDISSAGFTTILSVHITPVENINNSETGAIAQVKSITTTSLIVNMLQSKTTNTLLIASADGLKLHASPASVTYYVEVTGY